MYMDASKELPVSLCLDTDVDSLATFLYTVPAERLRRLDLNLDSLESDTHVEFLTTRTAPNLECLTMLASDENYDWSEMRCPPARIQLLSGQADALKALALQHLGSWLPSNSFPNLTHLHLSFSVTSGVCTLDILAVLANAPNLVFVFIDRLLRIGDGPVVPGAIALSRLRSLALVDCRYLSAISFLKQLALPEHCVVRLSYLSIYTGPEQEGEPAPLPDAGPLHHATKLDIAASHNEMLLVADSDTSGYWVQAQRDDLRTTWDAWLHDLPAMMTLSAITSLHINIDPDHTFWSPVLRHMPAVTELKAFIGETWTGRPLPIDILCAILSEEPVLLPSLRDLYVQGTDNNDTVTTLASESAAFVDIVVYRARTGHRLRRLRVQPDCDSHYGARTATHDPFGSRLGELAANVDHFELLGFGNPLCKYEMRDVWHVDGADSYWKPREEDRACYVLPKMLSYCV